MAGLLYVDRNVVHVVVSYPVGLLSDRCGPRCTLEGGYWIGAAMAVTAALAFPPDPAH
jgi:hypothetical protein